jgi:hypothetical protein
MTKKNKIQEIDTSNSTGTSTNGNSTNPSTTSNASASAKNSGVVTIDSNAMKKTSVVNAIKNLKNDDITVDVVQEEESTAPEKIKLSYLSEIKDKESGEISKPFTIGDKRYQMVRAINNKKEKVLGVYSYDEMDELGENVIYDANDFETNVAKKHVQTEKLNQEEPKAKPAPEPKAEPKSEPKADGQNSFAGFKHFIVNKATGKARKFKTIEELAKASMADEDQYMGIKDFKKFVDEALFGAGKKQVKELNTTPPSQSDIDMNQKAEKLIQMIKDKIPESIIKTIVAPVAKREVIAAFAELIGVPRNQLATLTAGLKDISKQQTQGQVVNMNTNSTQTMAAESRIIKVKDLK